MINASLTRLRRLRLGVLSLLIAIGALILVVGSPIALGWIASANLNWSRLSDAGSAYGGISAVVSSLALVGIAISLFLQWHQIRVSQQIGTRELHFALIKMTIDEPRFQYLRSTAGADLPLRVYFNLWVAHWHMLWDIGALPEHELRWNLDELFSSPDARDWWRLASGRWNDDEGSRKHKRFFAIAQQQFKRSVESGEERGQPDIPEPGAQPS